MSINSIIVLNISQFLTRLSPRRLSSKLWAYFSARFQDINNNYNNLLRYFHLHTWHNYSLTKVNKLVKVARLDFLGDTSQVLELTASP